MKTFLFTGLFFMMVAGCSSASDKDVKKSVVIDLEFTRIKTSSYNPFDVTVKIFKDDQQVTNVYPKVQVEKGKVSEITFDKEGNPCFTVYPVSSGIYPVIVEYSNVAVKREALVVTELSDDLGQPLLVPGLVNTDGYEDGITITPDGQYLFIQYGPLYFSGVFLHQDICAEDGWSLYDLVSCQSKPDSDWVFNTIGPYTAPERPGFPVGGIKDGRLTHLDIVLENVANRIALFPTVFYGFKRLEDGTFGDPFKLAFDDFKGANSPYGLSFMMKSDNEALFIVSWDNYFNHLGDDGFDVYYGNITMGEDSSLGKVIYEGEGFSSIDPVIRPVGFDSHIGVQGNSHLYYDNDKKIRSIWTDDERDTRDITVNVLIDADFPDGTWTHKNLPAKINTTASETQPFFTGKRLYLNREVSIVYHEFIGSSENDYTNNDSWRDEVVVVKAGETGIGEIFGAGEPTLCEYNGKKYLYFVYVQVRAEGEAIDRKDYDMGAAFVEIE
ncbi:MAG: PD40 domain-containing protein [Spirochaetes bacterium]|nr:PD40 domain-containing protein [Spirochaetota bacterium]MBN2772205.1 PD40 domain-containing protein [Spirochaetota bacterium]